jgi:hypothetical protein
MKKVLAFLFIALFMLGFVAIAGCEVENDFIEEPDFIEDPVLD